MVKLLKIMFGFNSLVTADISFMTQTDSHMSEKSLAPKLRCQRLKVKEDRKSTSAHSGFPVTFNV